jgi:drug/metabolite transporter (DMT)-like permease
MATQVVGTLLSILGVVWIALTVEKAGQQPVFTLMGVVGIIGGLILWGLGRIEVALRPPKEQNKPGGYASLLLVLAIPLVVIVLVGLRFFSSSAP